ncbi:heavy metal translocating P-type ATPase [Marinobacter bohaiensis]|uniref:heavy metal translocating P-type ATPase n=1 Tax=Marinobacter bohaiensis TaxID=2201898 RepID=UPI000DAE3B2B|nr:heavy metal translocating P-type ATPase [Marinobacter bohaiensis]
MSDHTCFHCGEPVSAHPAITLTVDGETRGFCCQGCRAVCQLIVDEHLTGFYHHRTARPATPQPLDERRREQLALYDHERVQQTFVSRTGDANGTPRRDAQLLIDGLSCAACIWLLEHHLAQQPGVEQFSVNHSTRRARLVWNPDRVPLSHLLEAIHELGYGARPYEPDQAEAQLQREKRGALIRLWIAGAGTMQNMMLAMPLYFGLISGVSEAQLDFFRWVSLLVATPVVMYSARPFFRNALRDLRSRHLTMDLPVALAIGLAYVASAWVTVVGGEEVYFESVCMFTFFLSLGRYIEMQARYRAGLSSGALASSPPPIATRETVTGFEVVPVQQLHPGDRVRIRPGEVVPVDGIIESGHSTLNEAALTGEYLPEARGPGSRAHAGSINGENPLTVRVERVGQQTRLSSILRILDRVQAEKPRVSQLADRVAGVFVSRILLIAPAVWLGWWLSGSDTAFDTALSVLVVTCPCALSLATPTVLTTATVRLRRAGFLPTRGHTLELLNRTDTVVFDKTGTLTRGQLSLIGMQTLGSLPEDTCRALAGGLEQFSEHPVGQALKVMARPDMRIDEVANHLAGGLTGQWQGRTYAIGHRAFVAEQTGVALPAPDDDGLTVFLASEAEPLASFLLDDAVRADARDTVQSFRDRGIHTVLLSGDRSGHVEKVGRALGIDTVCGQASPEEKLAFLRRLEDQDRHVLMVGDGLNDLPVMAGAEVSVAVDSATDLTRLKADAVLLGDQLTPLATALDTARQTRRIIRQNMAWALCYNLCALPLAAAGLVPPWAAALGMSASSLIVVLNALRLGQPDAKKPDRAAQDGLASSIRPDTVT